MILVSYLIKEIKPLFLRFETLTISLKFNVDISVWNIQRDWTFFISQNDFFLAISYKKCFYMNNLWPFYIVRSECWNLWTTALILPNKVINQIKKDLMNQALIYKDCPCLTCSTEIFTNWNIVILSLSFTFMLYCFNFL